MDTHTGRTVEEKAEAAGFVTGLRNPLGQDGTPCVVYISATDT
jgi:hypothetical protein